MSIFSSKSKMVEEPMEIQTIKCPHKWKDFDWYVDSVWYSNALKSEIKVFEPYVCIYCKERKDILLDTCENSNVKSLAEADKIEEAYLKPIINRIKPRAIVEDEINDMQLVDREYLRLAESLGIIS